MVEVTNTEVSEAEILITLLMVRRDALFTVDVSLINKPLLLLAIRDNMHSSEFREETDLHLCQKQIQNKATSRHNHPVAAVGSVLLPGINRCANKESAVQCVYWSYKGFKEIPSCDCFLCVFVFQAGLDTRAAASGTSRCWVTSKGFHGDHILTIQPGTSTASLNNQTAVKTSLSGFCFVFLYIFFAIRTIQLKWKIGSVTLQTYTYLICKHFPFLCVFVYMW